MRGSLSTASSTLLLPLFGRTLALTEPWHGPTLPRIGPSLLTTCRRLHQPGPPDDISRPCQLWVRAFLVLPREAERCTVPCGRIWSGSSVPSQRRDTRVVSTANARTPSVNRPLVQDLVVVEPICRVPGDVLVEGQFFRRPRQTGVGVFQSIANFSVKTIHHDSFVTRRHGVGFCQQGPRVSALVIGRVGQILFCTPLERVAERWVQSTTLGLSRPG